MYFGSYCCYTTGKDVVGKDVPEFSYITNPGFDPSIRIAMNKWKREGLESILQIEYTDKNVDPLEQRKKFLNNLKKDKDLYDFFMGKKKMECYTTTDRRKFIDEEERLANFLKNNKQYIGDTNTVLTNLYELEKNIINELS